jgi:hypothetical protein
LFHAKGHNVDTLIDRRRYARLNQEFPVKARVLGTPVEVEGVTLDVSQGGAFIVSLSWSAFHSNDQTEIQFSLPPTFTGQERSLFLEGPGIVARVDGDRLGIAVEFLQELRTFKVIQAEKV